MRPNASAPSDRLMRRPRRVDVHGRHRARRSPRCRVRGPSRRPTSRSTTTLRRSALPDPFEPGIVAWRTGCAGARRQPPAAGPRLRAAAHPCCEPLQARLIGVLRRPRRRRDRPLGRRAANSPWSSPTGSRPGGRLKERSRRALGKRAKSVVPVTATRTISVSGTPRRAGRCRRGRAARGRASGCPRGRCRCRRRARSASTARSSAWASPAPRVDRDLAHPVEDRAEP